MNPKQDNCLENTVLLRHIHLSKFETSFNFLIINHLLIKTILSNTKRKLYVLTPFSSSSLLACRTWAELNANELKQRTSLIYIEFGSYEVRRLTRTLHNRDRPNFYPEQYSHDWFCSDTVPLKNLVTCLQGIVRNVFGESSGIVR